MKDDLRWWWQLARPHAGPLLLGLLLAVITLAANMALLAVAGWFIAAMAAAGLAGTGMNYFTPAAAIRGLAILRTGGRYLERVVNHDATLRILTALRVRFYRQVEPLSPQQLSGLRSGDLLARVRADIDALSGVYLTVFVPWIAGALCLAGAIAVWAAYDARLAWVDLVFLALAGGLLPGWLARRAAAPGAAAVALSARLKAALVETIDGLGELWVFGAFSRHAETIGALTEAQLDEEQTLSRLAGLGDAGLLILTQAAMLASVAVIVPLIRSGVLAPRDIAPVVLLVLASAEALAPMSAAWQALGRLRAATHRLRAFEHQRPMVVEPAAPVAPPDHHDIVFDQVGVRPGDCQDDDPRDSARWALHDVSARITAGERVAIVGASGAGKTTLVQLLARLLEPEQGVVRWGGTPVTAYRSDDLRALMALVPQQIYLFHASVADNIAVGDPSADRPAIEQAATRALVHDEIMALPKGYDTLVGEEGLRLSGGQIRRIGIARALLRDAPVVVMDEPGEGLDSLTAAALRAAWAPWLRGRTWLVVSHQADWVAACDRVLVLDRGRLVGDGSPATLTRTCPEYRRLLLGLDRLDTDQRAA